MKNDNRIYLLTFAAFGVFLLFLCYGTYLNAHHDFPGMSFSEAMFDTCVTTLSFTSDVLNVDFQTINVIIFCVFVPIAFIGLLIYTLILRMRLSEANEVHNERRYILREDI